MSFSNRKKATTLKPFNGFNYKWQLAGDVFSNGFGIKVLFADWLIYISLKSKYI